MNNWSEYWSSFIKSNYDYVLLLPQYQEILEHVSSSITPGSIVLDAGCGSGNLSAKLSESHFVVGVDFSSEMLRIASRKVKGSAVIMHADLSQLSFASQSFDVVTCINVLYNVDNPQKVLRELYRVLKPGGSLLLSTPKKGVQLRDEDVAAIVESISADHKEQVKELLVKNQQLIEMDGIKFSPSKEEFISLLGGIGFQVKHHQIHYYDCNHFVHAFKAQSSQE